MRSMTGYGRCEMTVDGMDVSVEIKSVNHRFADYSIRVPRYYGFMEELVKKFLQQYISRGKVDVYVSISDKNDDSKVITLNTAMAEGYINAMRELVDKYGIKDDISASSISRFSDIFDVEYKEEDEETIFARIIPALEEAKEKFINMRKREGDKLTADMLMRKAIIEEKLAKVEELAPNTVDEYKAKLEARISELMEGITIDESRVMTEIAIYADKLCVTEETVRLHSHLKEFEHILSKEEAAGRRLDFLLQEMNREVNTMGSKCNDLEIGKCVVDMKTELEKIREQLQNLE
ncbi:MAG: YicC family protein [Eubacteriales bacterium]|nr:YicC family protein [Eubacteriales bacterium]